MMTGKEALIALANGEEVECRAYEKNWVDAGNHSHNIGLFFDGGFQFRLKPRTITINGIEVPAPFESKDGDKVYFIDCTRIRGYSSDVIGNGCEDKWVQFGAWRTESEIQQVVAALRSIFK